MDAAALRERAMTCLLSARGCPLRLSIANAWLALAEHHEAMKELISGDSAPSGERRHADAVRLSES
jgi:hypothetical protein